ncbi:MAG: hypothetical protein MJ232_08655 [archaeon]|nr:hypothetical protein [archaeon]
MKTKKMIRKMMMIKRIKKIKRRKIKRMIKVMIKKMKRKMIKSQKIKKMIRNLIKRHKLKDNYKKVNLMIKVLIILLIKYLKKYYNITIHYIRIFKMEWHSIKIPRK